MEYEIYCGSTTDSKVPNAGAGWFHILSINCTSTFCIQFATKALINSPLYIRGFLYDQWSTWKEI